MFLLDTSIVSEMMRPAPDPRVEAWLATKPAASLFLSAISEAELRYGIAILPDGQRRHRLAREVDAMLREDFAGRIIPFHSVAASRYAVIAADRRAIGRPIAQADCQIAAIARSRGAGIVMRNVRAFEECGIEIMDPWQHA